MSSTFAPTRTFTNCLSRAKHCYSSKLAEHQSGEGRGFLMIVDFFFLFCYIYGGEKVCFQGGDKIQDIQEWQAVIFHLVRLLIGFDRGF